MLRISETKIDAKINFKLKRTNMSVFRPDKQAPVIDTKFTIAVLTPTKTA